MGKRTRILFLFKYLGIILGIFSTGILLVPAKPRMIILALICCAFASVLFVIFRKMVLLSEASWAKYRRVLPFALITAFFLIRYFYHTWLPSSRVAAITVRLGLTVQITLAIVSVILGLFSSFFLLVIYAKLKNIFVNIFGTYRWWNSAKKTIVIIVICTVQLVQLESSALSESNISLRHNFLIMLVNI